MEQEVTRVIFDAFDEVNEHLPDHRKIKKSAQTVLVGNGSGLESLTVVSLMVAIEQRIEEKYGVLVNLADGESLSSENNPFRTVTTLAEHIHTLIGAAKK